MKLKTFGLALAACAFINISHAQSALSLDALPVVGDLLGGGSLLSGLDLAGLQGGEGGLLAPLNDVTGQLPLGLGGADSGGLGGLTAGLPLDGLPTGALLGGGLGGNTLMGGGIPLVGTALAGTPLSVLALPANLVLLGTLGSLTGGGLPLPI